MKKITLILTLLISILFPNDELAWEAKVLYFYSAGDGLSYHHFSGGGSQTLRVEDNNTRVILEYACFDDNGYISLNGKTIASKSNGCCSADCIAVNVDITDQLQKGDNVLYGHAYDCCGAYGTAIGIFQVGTCPVEDIAFPNIDDSFSYSQIWKVTDSNASTLRQKCTESHGEIEKSKKSCVDYERCKYKECDQNDTDFPKKAENQTIAFSWEEGKADRTQECENDRNGTKQTRKVKCKEEYRCLTKTDNCEAVKDEPINSYVSPSDGTFHEDIEITGTGIGLHYSSGNLDESSSKTVAYGWSLSNHAVLNDDRLYLGSGKLFIVEPKEENALTVVKLGGSEYLFDAEGNHVQTRDIYTKEVHYTFEYDPSGLLTAITDRFNETTTLDRDSSGVVTSVTAPHGQVTHLHIDESSDLLEVQYEDTASYSFEYTNHLMSVEREPNGNEFIHIFDKVGNIIKVIDAEQGEWVFGESTEPTLLNTVVSKASGDAITYQKHFLENGMLKTEKILPTGEKVVYENTIDDTISSTTSCGMKTTRVYKTLNGTLYKDPILNKRVLQSTTTTTPSGLSKETAFDTSYVFDGTTLQKKTDTVTSNGTKTTTTRDYEQHTQTTTSAENIKTVQTYDSADTLLLSSQYGDLLPSTYTYDSEGRVTTSTQGTRVTTSTYDVKGNLASVTDPNGKTTTYSYDDRGRVVEVTYPDGHATKFTYDLNGNMTILTTPTPTDHSFAYNGVNKKTNYTSPLQKQTTYTYDKQRRITKITKPSGKSIDTTYTNGRATAVSTPEGTTNYSYDCQNNPSTITKGDESFTFTYDGSLPTSMTQSGVLSQTLDYSYNSDFNVKNFTYAGSTTNYSYNKDRQLIQSGDFTLTRDINNSLVTQLSDGTLTQKRVYNDYGELNRLDDGTIAYQLHRDNTKIISKTEFVTKYEEVTNGKGKSKNPPKTKLKKVKEKVTYDYKFDERDRLVEVYKDRALVEEYTYDANGNRASSTLNGVTTTASYTLDDQLEVYGDNTYRYDEDGYLSEKTTLEGTTTYTYGTMGELKEVSTPTQTITYQHNALNQRVAKLVNGQVVEKYLWANLTTLLAVYDANDNLVQRFEYADQRMPVSMSSKGTKYYLHYDQVGSLRAVSDASGNIVKEVVYDTFGNIVSDSNPDFKVPFGFAGGLSDSDTGLTRFGYRDYNSYTGKWTVKDPIGFAGGDSNLYGYVLGDPINSEDPSGLDTKLCSRGLGAPDKPDRSIYNPFSHQYLVVDGEIYSFQAGDNMIWSDGFIDNNENPNRESCQTISTEKEYDQKVLNAIKELGATKYNVWAYPGSITYVLGARNCQTWAREILDRANNAGSSW